MSWGLRNYASFLHCAHSQDTLKPLSTSFSCPRGLGGPSTHSLTLRHFLDPTLGHKALKLTTQGPPILTSEL